MAFSDYKRSADVITEFQLTYVEASFVEACPFPISDYFREDLTLVMRDGVVDNSEFAICENLVYPILKEVWKPYRAKFILWSHQGLACDEKSAGFPEYILARRSPLGKIVFDQPYFILVEAKQDNFEAAWGQCLAEMVAAQRLNTNPALEVFGIASNGNFWEFGKLNQQVFTKQPKPYSIYELDALFAAVNYLFQQSESQLDQYLAA
jgi:hypothetical protein